MTSGLAMILKGFAAQICNQSIIIGFMDVKNWKCFAEPLIDTFIHCVVFYKPV